MIDTARIAKNTIFLYLRMILVLAANFYAVRILLEVLGVEDYGLFNLIVGFVTLFTFLNGAMMSTVQRFLCYAMGKRGDAVAQNVDAESFPRQNQEPSTTTIFSLCFYLFLALAAIIFLASETGGLWFVYHKLNIPPDRFRSAQIVYQLSIVVMLFKTMQIPYTALIISYERMNAFAKISIVEAVLTLGAALAIKWTPGDNLIVYTVLYTLAQAIVCLAYALYCRRHFIEGRVLSLLKIVRAATNRSARASRAQDPEGILPLLKQLSSFFSWSILGAVANMLKQQGLNVLLNIFFGVAFNATWAIANKIGMAVNQLVGNFQQAFNPQIVKLWAAEDKEPFYKLLFGTSKLSFFLLWVFVLPLMLCIDWVLSLWLGSEIPPQLPLFINLNIVFFLFEALSGPLWIAAQATGRIASYQIYVSAIIGSTFVLGWIALKIGAPAWSVMAINAVVDGGCHLFRIIYLRKMVRFPAGRYLKNAMVPVGFVVMISAFSVYVIPSFGASTNVSVIRAALISLVNIAVVLLIGLTTAERQFVIGKIRGELKRNCGR